MNVRNPQYNFDGSIDCEIEHPKFGWIPFTASLDDPEAHGKDIYQRCVDGDFGEIAPYETPPEPTIEEKRDRMKCTRFAGRMVMSRHGLLDAVEQKANDNAEFRIWYEDRGTWRRTSETLTDAYVEITGSEDGLDDLFVEAMAIDEE